MSSQNEEYFMMVICMLTNALKIWHIIAIVLQIYWKIYLLIDFNTVLNLSRTRVNRPSCDEGTVRFYEANPYQFFS